jgi:hypothetical protein
MKTLLLSYILAGVTVINAQGTFNRAGHNGTEPAIPQLIEMNGNYYFISFQPFLNYYLNKYDKNGNLLLHAQVLNNVVNAGLSPMALKTLDNNFLVYGNNGFCDTGNNYFFISKMDTNGTAIFTNTLFLSQFSTLNDCKAAIQYSDSTYVVFTDSTMVKFNSSGGFMSKVNLGLNSISSVIELPNGNLLVSARQNTISVVAECSSSGSLISQNNVPYLFSEMRMYGGSKIIGQTASGNLCKLSSTYQVLGISSFTNASVTSFDFENDSLFLLTYSAQPGYMVCDTSFIPMFQSITSTKRVNQISILKSGSKVGILSNCDSDQQWQAGNTFHSLNVINVNSSNNFIQDVGVLSVTFDGLLASAVTKTLLSGSANFFNLSCNKALITVKNYGNTQVNSFMINKFVSYYISCGSYYYQSLYSNLILNPGDTITVATSSMSWAWSDNSTSHTFTLCFYTTIPNHENDKVIGNDGFCYSVPVSVGLNERPLNTEEITIFPNPVSEEVSISSHSPIESVTISDLQGREIQKQRLKEKNGSINLTNLSPGLYMLLIHTGKGVIVKRVIKN